MAFTNKGHKRLMVDFHYDLGSMKIRVQFVECLDDVGKERRRLPCRRDREEREKKCKSCIS
jgi:hypothetical protein